MSDYNTNQHIQRVESVGDYIESKRCPLCGIVPTEELYKAMDKLAEEPKTKWIPCSERLPEPQAETQRRHWFLTTNAYGNVSVTKYEFKGDFGFIGWGTNRPIDIRIIAWMPLPEPYKGDE